MRFLYLPYDCAPSPAYPATVIYRPAPDVRVIGLTHSVPLRGIVDTGAAECVLPYDILESVGAVYRDDEIGVILDYTGRPHPVQYGLVDLEVPIKGRPLRWRAKVAFDPSRDPESALWGHVGFLEYFNASFHGAERHFTLRPARGVVPRPVMPIP